MSLMRPATRSKNNPVKRALLLLALMLPACDQGGTDASGASPGEAQALNEAAAMLDNNSVSANAMFGNDLDQDTQ